MPTGASMSVDRGRTEVIGGDRTDAFDPQRPKRIASAPQLRNLSAGKDANPEAIDSSQVYLFI